jgi:hypothetical protein
MTDGFEGVDFQSAAAKRSWQQPGSNPDEQRRDLAAKFDEDDSVTL